MVSFFIKIFLFVNKGFVCLCFIENVSFLNCFYYYLFFFYKKSGIIFYSSVIKFLFVFVLILSGGFLYNRKSGGISYYIKRCSFHTSYFNLTYTFGTPFDLFIISFSYILSCTFLRYILVPSAFYCPLTD